MCDLNWCENVPQQAQYMLGKGSYGAVFQAWLDADRKVAVKFFVGKHGEQNLMKEASMSLQAQGGIGIVELLGGCQRHIKPQVVGVQAIAEQVSYLVYEHCDGGDLGKAKKLTTDVKLRLLNDVIGGLMALHSRNVLHRDLHFANVFLKTCSTGLKAVLGDFGISSVGNGLGRPMEKAAGSENSTRWYWVAPESRSCDEGVWTDI
jgi:serine/threonine protein kinase